MASIRVKKVRCKICLTPWFTLFQWWLAGEIHKPCCLLWALRAGVSRRHGAHEIAPGLDLEKSVLSAMAFGQYCDYLKHALTLFCGSSGWFRRTSCSAISNKKGKNKRKGKICLSRIVEIPYGAYWEYRLPRAGFVTAFAFRWKFAAICGKGELAKRNYWPLVFDSGVLVCTINSIAFNGGLALYEIGAGEYRGHAVKPSLLNERAAVCLPPRLKLFVVWRCSFLMTRPLPLTGRIFIIECPKGQRCRQKNQVTLQHEWTTAFDGHLMMPNRWKTWRKRFDITREGIMTPWRYRRYEHIQNALKDDQGFKSVTWPAFVRCQRRTLKEDTVIFGDEGYLPRAGSLAKLKPNSRRRRHYLAIKHTCGRQCVHMVLCRSEGHASWQANWRSKLKVLGLWSRPRRFSYMPAARLKPAKRALASQAWTCKQIKAINHNLLPVNDRCWRLQSLWSGVMTMNNCRFVRVIWGGIRRPNVCEPLIETDWRN